MRSLIVAAVAAVVLALAGPASADTWHWYGAGQPSTRVEFHPATGNQYPYFICYAHSGGTDGFAGDNIVGGGAYFSCVQDLYSSTWRDSTDWFFDTELWNAFTKVRNAQDTTGFKFDLNGEPVMGAFWEWNDVPPAFNPNWHVDSLLMVTAKAGWKVTSYGSKCSRWSDRTVSCQVGSPLFPH